MNGRMVYCARIQWAAYVVSCPPIEGTGSKERSEDEAPTGPKQNWQWRLNKVHTLRPTERSLDLGFRVNAHLPSSSPQTPCHYVLSQLIGTIQTGPQHPPLTFPMIASSFQTPPHFKHMTVCIISHRTWCAGFTITSANKQTGRKPYTGDRSPHTEVSGSMAHIVLLHARHSPPPSEMAPSLSQCHRLQARRRSASMARQ